MSNVGVKLTHYVKVKTTLKNGKVIRMSGHRKGSIDSYQDEVANAIEKNNTIVIGRHLFVCSEIAHVHIIEISLIRFLLTYFLSD